MFENEKNEINALKQHLLHSLPAALSLSSDSIAVKAAISGLDKELSRLEREEKLMLRFQQAASSSSDANSIDRVAHAEDDADMEYVKMSKADASDTDHHPTSTMKEEEWMEATLTPSNNEPASSPNAEVAQKWASAAIARISRSGVTLETPLGALGLVLHSALMELASPPNGSNRGNAVGRFRCTGIPADEVVADLSLTCKAGTSKPKDEGGFAPPVRELPNGQLVPPKWESGCSSSSDPRVAFRYKCGKGEYTTDSIPHAASDESTLYLLVEPTDEIYVYFGPLLKPSSPAKRTSFSIDSHINIDGLRASLEKSAGPASPLLFYKSLKELLLLFGMEFGLMDAVRFTYADDEEGANTLIKDESIVDAVRDVDMNPVLSYPKIPTGPAVDVSAMPPMDPLRVETSHTGRRRRGDFEGDLLPGGPLPGPDIAPGPNVGGGGLGGGSQVGPNHPLFDRTFGEEEMNYGYGDDLGLEGDGERFRIPGVGGLEMRPRFDPFGPPGGPTEPGRGLRGGRGGRTGRGQGRGRGPAPPGGFGFPNPDHLRPPGGDYFG
eukprot:CCRYP_009487-RA/>CCRYP_009487-RA protein AED:0.19 eAED:0.19 QI:246/1/1/1/1/1/2/7139/550